MALYFTMKLHKTTLPSGLRLLIQPMAGTKTVTVMVTVGTGSKYEQKDQAGLTHFLEHLMFKGTQKRPTALAISETLDAVGGEYNAFTDKELTSYYAKVAANHFDLALDVISDMLLNSKLAAEEIEREKGVIVEEMNMYQDTPMRYVSDIFEALLYGDTPAGRRIIGVKETVRAFNREHFVDYWRRQYTAPNMSVTVTGACGPAAVQAAVAKAFAKLLKTKAQGKDRVIENQTAPALKIFEKKTDQMHLRLGVRTFGILTKQRPTLEVMAAILGGGMSSRLFINIRERQGLCYYVYADTEFFTDHGYLAAQAGVTSEKLGRAAFSIGRELARLKNETISEAELTKAKEYIKGKALLRLEQSDAMAGFLAREEALTGRAESVEEFLKHIDKVTAHGIKEVAGLIFKPERLNLAVIGPVQKTADLERVISQIF